MQVHLFDSDYLYTGKHIDDDYRALLGSIKNFSPVARLL